MKGPKMRKEKKGYRKSFKWVIHKVSNQPQYSWWLILTYLFGIDKKPSLIQNVLKSQRTQVILDLAEQFLWNIMTWQLLSEYIEAYYMKVRHDSSYHSRYSYNRKYKWPTGEMFLSMICLPSHLLHCTIQETGNHFCTGQVQETGNL